jgi:hypothetical protein
MVWCHIWPNKLELLGSNLHPFFAPLTTKIHSFPLPTFTFMRTIMVCPFDCESFTLLVWKRSILWEHYIQMMMTNVQQSSYLMWIPIIVFNAAAFRTSTDYFNAKISIHLKWKLFKSNLAQSLLPVDLPVLTAMVACVTVQDQEMHTTQITWGHSWEYGMTPIKVFHIAMSFFLS